MYGTYDVVYMRTNAMAKRRNGLLIQVLYSWKDPVYPQILSRCPCIACIRFSVAYYAT